MFSTSPKKASRWKAPMRMWPWLRRVSTAERVGEGSSPRTSSSPVSNKAKVFDVLTPSASSISVASTSRTPPLSVSRPSAVRLYGVWPEPLVPRSSRRPFVIAELGEEEAAAVADVGIVHPELVAVIAERERLGRLPGSGSKRRNAPPTPGLSLQPDALGPAMIEEARDRLGETAGLDRVVERRRRAQGLGSGRWICPHRRHEHGDRGCMDIAKPQTQAWADRYWTSAGRDEASLSRLCRARRTGRRC